MTEHSLIAAYTKDLRARLPAALAEEVLDGLIEAHDKYLRLGMTPEHAARAAIAEFGDPRIVADAFRRACPARRNACTLLVTGPVVGGCWASALIAGRAWDWPIPSAVPVLLGLTLAASVALLAMAVVAPRYHVVQRTGTAGCLGIVVLDVSAILTAVVSAPTTRWLLAIAACASAARLTIVARTMRPHLGLGS
jgi:hypothetical protein